MIVEATSALLSAFLIDLAYRESRPWLFPALAASENEALRYSAKLASVREILLAAFGSLSFSTIAISPSRKSTTSFLPFLDAL